MSLPENIWNNQNLIDTLKNGGVAVIPTDTIYGVVGQALNSNTVLHIYEIRKRNPDKPCVILIGDITELEKFSVSLSEEQKEKLKEYWVNNFMPISIILDCAEDKFSYLHRGTKTLAFRLPVQKEFRELLFKTGPLVAPSANTEALPPSSNIDEAKKYFGNSVDLYADGGEIKGKASKIIKLNSDGTVNILRD